LAVTLDNPEVAVISVKKPLSFLYRKNPPSLSEKAKSKKPSLSISPHEVARPRGPF